jgi:hypothetical protein
MSNLEAALQQFEAAEANLIKLEKLWSEIDTLIPGGPAFGAPPAYEDLCRAFRTILPHLPAIDGIRVDDKLWDYDDIGQNRLDALEVGEIEAQVSVERAIGEQGRQLRDYRFSFNAKRSHLIRQRVLDLVDLIDAAIRTLVPHYEACETNEHVEGEDWERMKEAVAEIDTLLGSTVQRPPRWSDLHRHMHFHMVADLHDIQIHDWPAVKQGVISGIVWKA